jgi:ribose transport system ATP-binding protein
MPLEAALELVRTPSETPQEHAPSGAALVLNRISKRFPGVQALQEVSLTVEHGEIHGLIGENGAGKSTLVNVLSGGVQNDAGTISVGGEVNPRLDPATAVGLGISVSHQEICLAANLTVAENILFGSLPTRSGIVRREEMQAHARVALEAIGSTIDPWVTVEDLSIAQQQMVEIARAVRLATAVLVLDEPTASLSAYDADKLLEAVGTMRSRGIAVIYVSHRIEEVLQVCDRVTVLRDGCKVGELECAATNRDELVRLMVGRDVSDLYPTRASKPGKVVLHTAGLRGAASPEGVSLDVREGEIVGVFGLVGAGRSEFVRLIAGIEPMFSGSIEVDGTSLSHAPPSKAMKHGVAFVSEDRKGEGLILAFTVAENLTLPNLKQIRRSHSLSRASLVSFAREQIRLVDIRPDNPNRMTAMLSGGNQQKTAIAKWLGRQPRLLIVDEPTRGIDVGAKAQIHELLARLAAEGTAVLMVSSELPEVLGLSDRIVVFHGGRIAGELRACEATPEIVMHLALSGAMFDEVAS